MASIERLFDELIERGGSDLHLGIGYPPMLRVRGELERVGDGALNPDEMRALLYEITDADQQRQIEAELDLDFAYAYADRARFRANYFFKSTGLAAVFRIIPREILSLEQLGVPAAVRGLAERKQGLVLVTGPTGSGKSTTLAAMIDHINRSRPCHIITIEDPVEFVHVPKRAQITHREIGPHASSFAAAIRSAGREDPDVVLIGELRGNEEMGRALQLASCGVLVFGTVHTNSAASTIDRIINAFPTDEQPQVRGVLAESLTGIVAQQLLRSSDGRSRVAAHEILLASSGIAGTIREGKTFQIPSLIQGGGGAGMQTMDTALFRLVEQGRITPFDALAKAIDKESLTKLFETRNEPS